MNHHSQHGDNRSLKSDDAARVITAEQHGLIKRVAGSVVFERAPRAREFLLFIGERAAQGAFESLSEQQIGIGVFGRPPSYNSSEDNIVRACARQLRGKLKEYFETEGAAEPLILEIPKGGYSPAFRARPLPSQAPAPKRSWNWLLASGCALAGAVAGYLATDRHAPPEPQTVMGAFVRRAASPVQFVFADSALVMMNNLAPGPVPLNKYADRSFVEQGAGRFQDGSAASAWRMLGHPDRQITSWADVDVLFRFAKAHPSLVGRVDIRHSRHMKIRDFKSGTFVIFGSPISTPWAELVMETLNFRYDLQGDRSNFLVNSEPRAGEPKKYFATPERGTVPALLALAPDSSRTGNILLIAGDGMEATEAAGEFILSADSSAELLKALGARPYELPHFEAVLEVKTGGGSPRSAKLVATRRR